MKPSSEEWYNRLDKLISMGGYELTNLNPVEETPQKSYKELKREYKSLVKRLTEGNKHLLEGISNRGWDSYHIDHKISIHYGFKNSIAPEDIANESNLRVISKGENCLKGTRCIIDSSNEWILKSAQQKETAKMEEKLANLIVGAVLSGQRSVMVGSIEVNWKPLKNQLSKKERETQANKIAKESIKALRS